MRARIVCALTAVAEGAAILLGPPHTFGGLRAYLGGLAGGLGVSYPYPGPLEDENLRRGPL